MGLQQSYRNDRGTHDFIRRVMALPFRPEEEIVPQFERLEGQVPDGNLNHFVRYVRATWIDGSTWTHSSWTVFMQSVRTNNDVEGWHQGLHRRASSRCQLPLYLLIDLLHREARLTSLNIRLVSEKKSLKECKGESSYRPKFSAFGQNLTMVSEARDNFLGPVLTLMDQAFKAKASRLILV